jgi:acetoin utilization deacetylase AcuC-like enzyme
VPPQADRHAPGSTRFSGLKSRACFDAHRDDDMSHLMWIDGDYAWLTRQVIAATERYAHGRVVSLLEGGYALSALARSAAAHVRVLIGAD